MKTDKGVDIKDSDLTHQFTWLGKTIPIGRFDPSSYPTMKEVSIKDLKREVLNQIEDFGIFTAEDLEPLCSMSEKEFNSHIRIRPTFHKTMDVDILTNTDGKGKNTEETRSVIISRLEIGYSSLDLYPEDPFKGELRAYFDPSGFTVGSWNVTGYGFIATDKRWLRDFKNGLINLGLGIKAAQNIKYSELHSQSHNYVALDVEHVFYTSWLNLHKKLSLT